MTDYKYRVMVTDEVDKEGLAILRAEPAIEVVERPTLPPDQLLEEIGQYDALIGRRFSIARPPATGWSTGHAGSCCSSTSAPRFLTSCAPVSNWVIG